jgi:hypothetical protein
MRAGRRISAGVVMAIASFGLPTMLGVKPAGATYYGGNGGYITYLGNDSVGNFNFFAQHDGAGSATPGDAFPLTDPGARYFDLSWSPDGSRLAFSVVSGADIGNDHEWHLEIWTSDAVGGDLKQLTNTAVNVTDRDPTWSPDGTRIIFDSNRNGATDIYSMNASDGSGVTRLTTTGGSTPAYSPDGTKIAYDAPDGLTVMNADGTSPHVIVNGVGWRPDWSPDGKHIVFVGSTYGFLQPGAVTIVNADGTDAWPLLYTPPLEDVSPTPVTGSGGAVFSPDGKRLAFSAQIDSGGLFGPSDWIVTSALKTYVDGTGFHWYETVAQNLIAGDVTGGVSFSEPTWQSGPIPVNAVAPSMSGTAIEGRTLTAAKGTWYGAPSTFTYQWQRCSSTGSSCGNITGAAHTSYTVGSSDVGHRLRVVVTATNGDGSLARASGVTAVAARGVPLDVGLPALSGTASVGHALSSSNGVWRGTATITLVSIAWYRCNSAGASCVAISGTFGRTDLLVAADRGHRIRSRVWVKNPIGQSSAYSAASAVIS